MSHFSEQAWADFARGFEVPRDRQDIEKHLEKECPECKCNFEAWERIARLAVVESDYEPPDNVVRAAKLGFPNIQAVELDASIPASLLFDSAVAPLPAGLRAGIASARQVVYEGEGLTADVRFERKPHSNVVSACGQVLDKEVPFRWLGRTRIVLWNDKGQLLTKTETGEYGEFQFEFVTQEQLRISIVTADRRTVRIALGNVE